MRQPGFITVEDCTNNPDFVGIGEIILDEFTNLEVSLVEDTDNYFVFKFICEDYEEVQEIVSIIGYILTGAEISKSI
jgi:hypothetical protein